MSPIPPSIHFRRGYIMGYSGDYWAPEREDNQNLTDGKFLELERGFGIGLIDKRQGIRAKFS